MNTQAVAVPVESPAAKQNFAALMGGTDLTVTKIDESTEVVKVRKLRLRDCLELLKRIDDENELIEFYCERPPGWSDTLTPESAIKVLEEGEGLNGDFFAQWVRRRQARSERVFPGIRESVRTAAAASVSSPPKQP